MPHLFLQIRDESEQSDTTPAPLTEDQALILLGTAKFTASKLIPWGSNYSFAVALETGDGREQLAIYKPRSGEAPLYDFPDGTLYKREVASYRLSRLLGWDLVPATIVRSGPHGVGSLQLYIEPAEEEPGADPSATWGSCSEEIERLVLFDIITSNADRKLSHCLRDATGKVWGIDHGLTFNEAMKLRTVLWQFVGSPVKPSLLDDLSRLRANEASLREDVGSLINRAEFNAFLTRIDRLVELGHHPVLNPRRNVPYGWW